MADDADNRVPLAAGWTAWPWLCVRGAGFDVRGALELAEPATAAAAAELAGLLDAERAAEAAAIVELEGVIDQRLGAGRKPIGKALRALRGGRDPRAEWIAGLELPALERLRQIRAEREAARAALDAAAGAERPRLEAALAATARSPRFREAVMWQNPEAVRTGIDRVTRARSRAKAQSRLQLVASYVQRYCTKNDTIGFMGPIGWGSISDRGDHLAARPGTGLLSSRAVYFEHWCIDALASSLARDPQLLAALPPRLAPAVDLEGDVLRVPVGQRRRLPPTVAAILSACDGTTPARAIAGSIDLDPDEVYEILGELVDQGVLLWTLEIPTATDHPDRSLRRRLEGLGAVGAAGLAPLAELEALRDRVARAAGDPDALGDALGDLGRRFEALTGRRSSRGAGETYAGRMLVYEDCVRDLGLELGAAAIARLARPLELVLRSARWFTHEIAARYRAAFRERYRRLAATTGEPALDYLVFWDGVRDLFSPEGGESPIVGAVAAELRRRWAEVLAVPPGASRVVRSAVDLEAAIAARFDAPGPGWPAARHHSPDLLIAAAGLEAAARGDYQLVLGELHVAINTVTLPFLAREHPRFDRLVAARERDLPGVHIAPVKSRDKTRAEHYSISSGDFDLEVSDSRSSRPRDQVIAVGALVIEERGETLVVRERRGDFELEVIAFVEQYLIAECHQRFDLVRPDPRCPRIAIDDLVISRQRWRLAPAELGLDARDPLDRLVAITAWAQRNGAPRHLFVVSDAETKPIYVDLQSPILVELLVRIARRSTELVVSEMLPAPDQCWLPGPGGEVFTSELRLATVDPRSWRPPPG